MAFVPQKPRLFTKQSIEVLNVGQIGVYGLFRQGLWVYVGKGDIKQRLLDHLNGDNPLISRAQPTHWVGELVVGDPSFREKELILEFLPICNQKVC